MWIRITTLSLVLTLVGSVAVGMPLHSSDLGCNMRMEMSGCEHMGMEPSAPGVTPMALCCLLNCQEPGATGTEDNLRLQVFGVAFLHRAALTSPTTLPGRLVQDRWLQRFSYNPPKPY